MGQFRCVVDARRTIQIAMPTLRERRKIPQAFCRGAVTWLITCSSCRRLSTTIASPCMFYNKFSVNPQDTTGATSRPCGGTSERTHTNLSYTVITFLVPCQVCLIYRFIKVDFICWREARSIQSCTNTHPRQNISLGLVSI